VSLSLAHRGAGIAAAENTLVAIEYGQDYGYAAVEFDVMLSKDNQPFLMHDEVLGRTVPGTGSCSDYTVEDMTAMDACKWHTADISKCMQSHLVPRYQEVMEYCKKCNVWMNVEIKPCLGFEDATGTVVAQFTKAFFAAELASLQAQLAEFQYTEIYKTVSLLPLFSSFSFKSLLAAKKEAPEIPRAYLIDNIADVPEWREQMVEIGAVGLHTSVKHLTKEQADEIKVLGYGLFVYTVNTVEDGERMLSWGVDSFCTDQLAMFQSMTTR